MRVFRTTRAALAFRLLLSAGALGLFENVRAADATAVSNAPPSAATTKTLIDVLPAGEWKQVESAVDRALAWMVSRQQPDGSFPSLASAQPAVTSFCVLAFLSRGHQPGVGPYGSQIDRAIDFVLSCQKPDGLLSYRAPGQQFARGQPSHTASYDHAVAGLMLGEVYGHVTGPRAKKVKTAIEKALQFTRNLQTRPKDNPLDKGGWRYVTFKGGFEPDSDLSVTSWQLMFVRSARNAEFLVPQEYVDEATAFVQRCWDPAQGVFSYSRDANGGFAEASRGLMGAGILSLSMAGQHQTPVARAAGDWLLAHPYTQFSQTIGSHDRFFYSTYYCSQAALQLGGKYWEGIFPPLVKAVLSVQSHDGSWPPEPNRGDSVYGNLYTTALAVLALTPPYQLLPVYQR
jgi:hypothetical protein